MKRLAFIAASLLSAPALPCTSSEDERIDEVLMPLGREVPTNVALFAVTPFRPTQVVIRQGDAIVAEHDSETGEINIGVLAANADYEVDVSVDGLTRRLSFHTTALDDIGPSAAPTASAVVTTDPGGVAFPNTCRGGLLGWRNGSTTVDVDVDISDDAVAAVRVNDDGSPVERAGADGSFRFSSVDTANDALFAVIDAAGNVSPLTQVEAVDAGGCAQTSTSTSTSTAMALALVGLLLARRRGRSERR